MTTNYTNASTTEVEESSFPSIFAKGHIYIHDGRVWWGSGVA